MLGQIDGFGAFSIADWWPFRALLLGGAAVCVLAALRWGRGVMQRTTDQWAKAHDEVAPVLVVPDINGSLLADTECVDSSRQVGTADAEPLAGTKVLAPPAEAAGIDTRVVLVPGGEQTFHLWQSPRPLP